MMVTAGRFFVKHFLSKKIGSENNQNLLKKFHKSGFSSSEDKNLRI